ncbi:alpha/beta hydrolase [Microbulbifer sp. JMSA004]|uniref:alpha/beta hydrolase n=1 Tax=Microbulbifer sp. JMSA004 TaxID=3243370 RepID=UPI00403A68B1
MYVITNREVLARKKGLNQFGKSVNQKGPNELRIAKITKKKRGWNVEFLADDLTRDEAKLLINKYKLPLDAKENHYVSLKVACEIAEEAREKKSHILFFVHGYNNDMGDIVDRAKKIEKQYGVIVIVFSWPANGGGIIGTISYKSDKRDAKASTCALERTLHTFHEYLRLITESRRSELYKAASEKYPDNPERKEMLFSKLLKKECPFTVNALFHSMGNYLYKQMLKSTITEGGGLIFDNVILAAADTNNFDHSLWVDRIAFRKRCFITINENDRALGVSRIKSGYEQLARLGHSLRNLNSRNAHYINFTNAPWVKDSHSYFANSSVKKNAKVHKFFQRAFSGESAEDELYFHAEGNWFSF